MSIRLSRLIFIWALLLAMHIVAYANIPPVADISNPYSLWLHLDPDPICFDGHNSYDPDGYRGWIDSWEWDFGDGHGDSDEALGVPHCVEHAYASTGRYYPDLTVWDAEGASDWAYFTATVVEVGLSLGPGYASYVAVNDDDDNENSIFDNAYYDEQLQVANENDLVEVLLYVDTPSSAGKVRLGVGAYASCIKIWSDPDRQNLIIPDNGDYFKRWTPGSQPDKVYVEGIAASPVPSPRYPEVMISYTRPSGAGGQDELIPDDGSNEITFTVLHIDMDMDGVKDDADLHGEVTEETTPGGFLQINDDDDNDNGTPDKDDTGPIAGEDDLVKLTEFKLLPTDLPVDDMYPVVLDVVAGGSKIKIYEHDDKSTGALTPPLYYESRAALPSELWVEGVEVSSSARDITLVLDYVIASKTFEDRIHLTVVKVDVDADLSEEDELSPGKYINVNWDDDDNDGWEPDDTPPAGTYTGDKDDSEIDGGDDDLRSFIVSISPWDIPIDFPNSKVAITFSSKVKVWETDTKKTILGESSALPSGSEYVVENLPKELYIEGVSGSSTFKDVELEATWLTKSFSDTVKVTAFEVDLTGFFGFGPQQNDNDKEHSSFQGSSDTNGKISWDDANADGTKGDNDPNCEYFRNCMECQGTVKPSGVTSQVHFDFDRKCWARMWFSENAIDWDLERDKTPWQPDDGGDVDEDQSPSPSNHIYQIDGPGLTWRVWPPKYVSHVGDFKEWVMVKIDESWYQCSDYL